MHAQKRNNVASSIFEHTSSCGAVSFTNLLKLAKWRLSQQFWVTFPLAASLFMEMFFKILDVNQAWYIYMWWWKSADILHEHNLSTPHCANWRFIDYVIWLIKIYFYKGYKTIYYKLWEKFGFHLSSSWMIDLGPTHATQVARSSCRISLVLLRERAGAP